MKCIVCSGEMKRIPLLNEVSRYNKIKYPLFKCEDCSFARPNPLPFQDHGDIDFYDKGEHIKFFDPKIGDINRESEEYKYYYKYSEPYMKMIEKYGIKGKSIDIGCGPGHLIELELNKGMKAEGMEVGPFLVGLLRRKFKIHQGLLGEVKLKNYDLATMNQVLEHIEEPEKAIREIAKALKKGGYFMLAVPYIYGIIPQVMRDKWYGLGYGQHLNFFSKKSMRMLLERNGFEVKEMKVLSVDYAQPSFPSFINYIARFIMSFNVLVGLGDNLFVVARKR